MFRRRGSKDGGDEGTAAAGGVNEKALDRRVTKMQTKAAQQHKQSIKLLILGGGGSGKTTLRKQFSRLYANAFKDAKIRVDLKDVILHNLVEGMKLTINAAETYAHWKKSPEAEDACSVIRALSEDQIKLNDEIVGAFRVLYNDPTIKETLELHRSKYQLQECFLPYFTQVQNYPEWGGPIWIPSEDGK
jgi:hypothetical protein